MAGKEMDYYKTLYELAKTINSSLEFSRVLEKIVQSVTNAMGVKACSIRLLGRQKRRLLMGASYGLSSGYLRKGPVEVEKSGIDREVLGGRYVAIRDARNDPKFQYPERAKQEGIVSVLVVPLMVEETPIGVLRVYTAECRDFSQDEVEFLTIIANLSAIAIENARLHQALKADYELLAAYEYRLFDD